jgi:hypothetical protein
MPNRDKRTCKKRGTFPKVPPFEYAQSAKGWYFEGTSLIIYHEWTATKKKKEVLRGEKRKPKCSFFSKKTIQLV